MRLHRKHELEDDRATSVTDTGIQRILHIAHGIPSYNNGLTELANRMRSAGIDILISSHNDLEPVLQSSGHPFKLLTFDATLREQRTEALQPTANSGNLTSRCRQLPRQIITSLKYRRKSLKSSEIEKLISQYKPDLLLIDMECHKAIIQSRTSGIPTVLLSRWFSVFKTGDMPPMHTSLMPPANRSESLKSQWQWCKLWLYKARLEARYALSRRRFRPVTYDANYRGELAAVARSSGIRLAAITQQRHWLIPHVYKHLPVMSLTAQSLEFGTLPDKRMNYVGAMVGSVNTRHPSYEDGHGQLQQFIAQRKAVANPLVYCSFSTFWDTGASVIEPVIALFSQRSDLDLVIGLGGRGADVTHTQLPENILVLDYAPQLEALESATIVITHGGISTINEALYHGVPLLLCSAGHVDQNGCVARAVYHQVGGSVNASPLTSQALEAGLDYLLSAESQVIHDKVKVVQQQLREYDEQNAAVEFLHSIR